MLPSGRIGRHLFTHLKVCSPVWPLGMHACMHAKVGMGTCFGAPGKCSLRQSSSSCYDAQVYKGPSHPHSAQQPQDITYKINKKHSEAVPPPAS
jgi:hypothetical protein